MIVTARRLHDIGRSGWWTLLMLLPMLNLLVFLVLAVFPGDTGPNKYGPRKAPTQSAPTPERPPYQAMNPSLLALLGS